MATRLCLIAVVAVCGCRAGGAARGAGAPSPPPAAVARYAKVELAVPRQALGPGDDDPFVEVTPPSGHVTRVFGFPSGDEWTFRFAPAELGAYRFVVRGKTGGRIARAGQFQAIAGHDPGPVRVDPRDHHRLRFEDGAPFFVLGENRINIYDRDWNYGHLSAADYLAAMAQNGMTTLRLFIVAACKPKQAPARVRLGCLEPRMGQFDESVARDLDGIFEAAETQGIYVVLTAFAIGFSSGDSWKDWRENPYNVANGGTAIQNREVFTRADLREAAKRKLRYLSARYGYSTHLLAIDLLNEPEWDGQIAERDWIPWAEDLARDWKARDPVGHLITVGSIGLSSNIDGDERPLYASPEIDLVEWHLYGVHDPRANAEEMLRRVRETWSAGKPIFCGEFAYGGEDPSLYDHTHNGIWAAIFAGAGVLAHSAPPFHIDSDEPMTPARGRQFRILADLLRQQDPAAGLGPDPTATAAPEGARVLALGQGGARAIWLLGPETGYGQPVAGATVTLSGVPAGRYAIDWEDDVTGQPVAAETALSAGERLLLHAPVFTRHVAARVRRAP